jgi:hypothetical protein
MRRTLMVSALCAGLSWPALTSAAVVQRDAASKDLGDAYYFYAAKTYGDHAADHLHILRQFVSTSRGTSIDWVQQHIGAVRDNVASTGWAYSQLSSRIKNNPDGAQQLSEIEEGHAKVLEICDRLEVACAEPTVDLRVISRTLDELQSTLSGARATQQEVAMEFGGSGNPTGG